MIAWLLGCRAPGPEPIDPTDPTKALADAGPDLVALVGEPLVLDAGGSTGALTWTLPDGTAVEGSPAQVTFPAPGHAMVVLTARGDDGSTDADDLQVTVTWPLAPVAPRSAGAVAVLGGRAFVPMPDFDLVAVVDQGTDHWPTCGRPRTVDATDAGLWVACADDRVVRHDADGAVALDVALPRGSRPFGVVADGDGALVTLQGLGAVARIEADGAVRVVAVEPDLRGLATFAGGALVSRWRSPSDGGVVVRLDADLREVERWRLPVDPGPDSDTNSRGVPSLLGRVWIRPDGRVAVLPGLKSNVERGLWRDGLPLTFETTSRADLRVVALDAAEGAPGTQVAAMLFDDRDQALAVAGSPLGDWLYVVHPGMETVDVLDAYTLAKAGALQSIGAGADALAVDATTGRLVISSPLSRTLVVFDVGADPVAPPRLPDVDLLPPSGEVRDPAELRGEVLFGRSVDPRMAKGGYLSCAVCHPEGDADGRTWDFTDRGEGLRDTIGLLGRAGAAPIHWTANFDEVQDFENDVRGPMGGRGLMSDEDFAATEDTLGAPKAGLSADLDALAAFVEGLDRPLPSPHRAPDGALTADGEVGAAIFADPAVGCAECHPPPTYTDSTFLGDGEPLLHDVGTLGAASGQRRGGPLTGLDTPSLRGTHASGPWLHDGSAPTLRAVLVDHNPDDRHGVTSGLGEAELRALESFLLQLE